MEALVRKHPELESFVMSNSGCTDKTLQILLNHPRMKVVGLSNSDVTGESLMLSSVCNNTVIKALNLSQCRYLTDDGIMAILNKVGETLKILDLSNNKVSFSEVGSMTRTLPSLEELNLQRCLNLTDARLSTFLNKLGESLKILNLSFTNLSFSSVEYLTKTFPVLEELYMKGCTQPIDAGLITFFNKIGESLKILDLSYTELSFSSVDYMTGIFPRLEKLNLMYCEEMTDEGLMAFLNKVGENLKILYLNRTKVSFLYVELLTSTYPELEVLHLSGCEHLIDAGLITFLNKIGETLRILDLSRTSVSFDSVESLDSFPAIEVLHLDSCAHLMMLD